MKFQIFFLFITLIASLTMITGLASAGVPVSNNDSFTLFPPTVNLNEGAIIANDDPGLADIYSTYNATNTSSPNHGTITGWDEFLGLFNYTSDGSQGVSFFTYKLYNGTDYSNEAYVVISRNNSAPYFDFTRRDYSGSPLIVNSSDGLLSNITNSDNDELFIIITRDVSFGNLSVSTDGSFNYTSNKTNGVDYFKYKVTDLDMNSAEILVVIVIGTNNAPVAVADDYLTANTANITGEVNLNDSDNENDTLFFYKDEDVKNGTLKLYSNGTFKYSPNENFSGIDYFTYYASDQDKNSSKVKVTLYVNTTIPVDNPTNNPVGSLGGNGGGGSVCATNWNCSAWSICENETQIRNCSYPEGYCMPVAIKPLEIQNCATIIENTPQTNQTQSNFVSKITGAVIGTLGPVGSWVLVAFIVLVTGAGIWFFLLKKKK
jgi:hypothetical protein